MSGCIQFCDIKSSNGSFLLLRLDGGQISRCHIWKADAVIALESVRWSESVKCRKNSFQLNEYDCSNFGATSSRTMRIPRGYLFLLPIIIFMWRSVDVLFIYGVDDYEQFYQTQHYFGIRRALRTVFAPCVLPYDMLTKLACCYSLSLAQDTTFLSGRDCKFDRK